MSRHVVHKSHLSAGYALHDYIYDLCRQGMGYIHRSDLNTHGNLKSYTCLVDSRWTVKVSFFGLHSLIDSANKCGVNDGNHSDMLWTAPELLRLCSEVPPGGTASGDVYSFGILLQEILFRNTPFFYCDISAEGWSGYTCDQINKLLDKRAWMPTRYSIIAIISKFM